MHLPLSDRRFQVPLAPHSQQDALIRETELTLDSLDMDATTAFNFETHFRGGMGMYGALPTVTEYLSAHEGWFCRCAKPMSAEPLGNNGYILTVGRFGSFGYEVEPKMGVVLQPPEGNVYLMYSVPVPNAVYLGYDIDYQASMVLKEVAAEEVDWGLKPSKARQALPPRFTQVDWQLHLKVTVRFPRFIHKLPQSLVQSTGDGLLAQIVRQVSPRLTYKVQKDFHENLGLPVPPKQSRPFVHAES